jgi:TRC40/GET3/ArsA family transport-energizing ATPase
MPLNLSHQAATPCVPVVIVSASCCVRGMEAFDEQARRVVQQAIAETGVEALVDVMPATTAFLGGIPRPIMTELMTRAQTGQMPVPAVLVDGKPISYGVPGVKEMTTFDQFVTFLDQPEGDVVVFDTAPTGKTLRELAMPFDWAGFLQKQIQEGKRLAEVMHLDGNAFEDLERDKQRYDHALAVLRNPARSVFTLALLPERLPIEETHSAINGLSRLGIPVQALVINQRILPEVIEGDRFLAARAQVQARYLDEIEERFAALARSSLPLLDRDVSDVATLRQVGEVLYGRSKPAQRLAPAGGGAGETLPGGSR